MRDDEARVRHVPLAIRRAIGMMGWRLRDTFAGTPYVFFAVVIGVAVFFRLGIGVLRSSTTPEPEVPVFASTEPAPTAAAKNDIAPANDAPAPAVTSTTAKPGSPAPARGTPRPRGHGRRGPHGG
jgi:hypothetical protein